MLRALYQLVQINVEIVVVSIRAFFQDGVKNYGRCKFAHASRVVVMAQFALAFRGFVRKSENSHG